MYNLDINTYMLQKNINDVKTLAAACNVNKNMIKICSTKYFWEPIFVKNNLPIPYNANYTNANDWLQEYDKTSKAMNKTLRIINFLPEEVFVPQPTNFLFFDELINFLNIKEYYEPEYLQDLANDGLTPHDLPALMDEFGQFGIIYIKFYIEDGLYIINFHFETTDAVTLYGNYEQVKDFLFYCFYHQYIYAVLSPINSPR